MKYDQELYLITSYKLMTYHIDKITKTYRVLQGDAFNSFIFTAATMHCRQENCRVTNVVKNVDDMLLLSKSR
jgi:hypothetical protein